MESLPNEIILQIFRHLSYADLKCRLPLVCRSFRSLLDVTKYGEVDQILYRDAPSSTGSRSYAAHPVFQYITYSRHQKHIDEIYLYSCKCCAFWISRLFNTTAPDEFPPPCRESNGSHPPVRRLIDTDVYNENATSPAAARLIIHVSDFKAFEVKPSEAGRGVSVRDFMVGLLGFMEGMPGKEEINAMRTNLKGDMALQHIMLTSIRADVTFYLRSGRYWSGVHRVEVKDGEEGTPYMYVIQKGSSSVK